VVKDGAMFADVEFWNGIDHNYYSATLLLDTGATVTTISESALKRLGCSISEKTISIRTAIGYGSVLKAKAAKLRIASFEFADMDVHAHVFPDSCDFDGVLGMDILGGFNFGFNLDENLMELNMRKSPPN
jgi:clan AA aspartic protease (TIGR02281 family)